jgi:hypothetical protein
MSEQDVGPPGKGKTPRRSARTPGRGPAASRRQAQPEPGPPGEGEAPGQPAPGPPDLGEAPGPPDLGEAPGPPDLGEAPGPPALGEAPGQRAPGLSGEGEAPGQPVPGPPGEGGTPGPPASEERPGPGDRWYEFSNVDDGAQASWLGQPPVQTATAPAPEAPAAEPAEGAPVWSKDHPAPWFPGPQAPWAGEAPPPGIHLSYPLHAAAQAGADSVTLAYPPPSRGAGQLQAGVLINLIRRDSSLSDPYTVGPGFAGNQAGNQQVPLDPHVRRSDAGAERLKTLSEPVPDVALAPQPGFRPPEPWWGGVTHLDDEEDPTHAIIPASMPGSHVRMGWGDASLTIGGMGNGA